MTTTTPTMFAEVFSLAGLDTIAITHLGLDVEGAVMLRGEDTEGKPFTVRLSGTDASGRSIGACLVELAGSNEKCTGRGGL
jgi:hypothetical protein